MKAHLFFFLLLLLVSLLAGQALFPPGLYTAHDIWHNVARFYWYHQAIIDGQLIPSWIGQLGYGIGYPLFVYSYHLPWLVGLPLLFVGLDFFTSFKLLFLLPLFLSGLTMYLLVYSYTHKALPAFIAAFLYIYAPYRFFLTFVAASTGVAWIFPFIPLLFLGLALSPSRPLLSRPCLAIGCAGLILSHLLTALTVFLAAGVFLLLHLRRLNWRPLLLGLLLGLLLSAFYLVPFLAYSPLTRASVNKSQGFAQIYTTNFVTLKQLLYSRWGYGPVIHNAKDGEISYQIGIAQWLSVGIACFTLILARRRLVVSSLLIFFFSVFLMTDFSRPFWDFATRFISFDYPSRFLTTALFSASLVSGLIIARLPRLLTLPLALLLLTIAVYTNRNHTRVNLYTDIPLTTYVASELTTNTHHEYFPAAASPQLLDHPQPLTWPDLSAQLVSQTTSTLSLTVATTSATFIGLNQVTFPGLQVFLNNQPQPLSSDSWGRVGVTLPPQTSSLSVTYHPTPLQIGAGLFSLVSYIILLAQAVKYVRSH